MAKKHLKITIRGKVQGVFFRQSTLQEAQALGVRGYIRNMPDGTVLTEAIGDKKQLKQFLAWCRSGPPNAEVVDVNVEEVSSPDSFSNFEIRS